MTDSDPANPWQSHFSNNMTRFEVGQSVMVAFQRDRTKGPIAVVKEARECQGFGGSQYLVQYEEHGQTIERLLYRYRLTEIPPLMWLAEQSE